MERNGGISLSLKRATALLTILGFAGLASLTPEMVLQQHVQVSFLYPTYTLYEQQVEATGQIVARDSWSLYLDTPVIANSVHVSLGDTVREGELLAELEQMDSLPASLPALETSSPERISSETLETLQNSKSFPALSKTGLSGGVRQQVPESVTSPMDGIVTALNLKQQSLNPLSQPAVTISNPDSLGATVQVGESEVAQIQVGDTVTLKGAGFPGDYSGVVSSISPVAYRDSIASQEAVVDVEVALEEPDTALREGFSVKAEIVSGEKRPLLTIPYEAIQQDENNVEYVYLVQDSQAIRRDIVTGMELTHCVEVIQGLSPWDVVIADVSKIHQEGDRVLLTGEEKS